MSPCHARTWDYRIGSLSQLDFILSIIPSLFHYIILCNQLSLFSFINSLLKLFEVQLESTGMLLSLHYVVSSLGLPKYR